MKLSTPGLRAQPQIKLEQQQLRTHEAEKKVAFLMASTQSPLEIPALVSDLENQACLRILRAPS